MDLSAALGKDQAMAKVSQRLQRRVQQDFGGEAAQVLAELEQLPESLPLAEQQNPERIQAAIVLPSEGDLESFWELVELAHLDWRDLLLAAELADQNWSQQLQALLD